VGTSTDAIASARETTTRRFNGIVV
jgi:hypothetical protein